jgi:hypothetical protein
MADLKPCPFCGSKSARLGLFLLINCWRNQFMPSGMARRAKIGLRPFFGFIPKYRVGRPVMTLGPVCAAHFAVFPFSVYRYFFGIQACSGNISLAHVLRYKPSAVLALISILPGAACIFLFNQFIKRPLAIFAGYPVVSNGSK